MEESILIRIKYINNIITLTIIIMNKPHIININKIILLITISPISPTLTLPILTST